MIGLRTSRFNENTNKNKIALNLFQGDIDNIDETDEYEEMLTKRGKIKNKSKIEYFKNYINNFKEKKFKTARPIDIFRKKEDKNEKHIKEKNEIIKFINPNKPIEEENNKNKFNKIKEIIQEGREAQMENMNMINNKRNELFNYKEQKSKKSKKEITNEIIKNNEDILKILKKNKNRTKFEEKEKIKNKIMNLKEKNKNNNLSSGKISNFLDKNNEKFFQLLKTKKLKLNKKKISKSFNKSNKNLVTIEEIQISSINNKTNPNGNINRMIKDFRKKFNMKIFIKDEMNIINISEKEIFNKKHKNNKAKINTFLSKSCFSKNEKEKDIFENDSRYLIKMQKKKNPFI